VAGHQNTALIQPDVVDAVEGGVPNGQHLTLQRTILCENGGRQETLRQLAFHVEPTFQVMIQCAKAQVTPADTVCLHARCTQKHSWHVW